MLCSVFAIFADVTPLPDTIFDLDVSDGRYVYCYLVAADENQATAKLRLDLNRHGLQLGNIQWCMNHDATDLERTCSEYEDASVHRARSGEFVYDRIEPMLPRP